MTSPARARSAVKILLIDDHPVVTEGLRLVLENDHGFDVIAVASSLEEAMAVDADPDVVVTDLVLGDAQGSAVVAAVVKRFAHAAVLVFTMVDDPDEIYATLAAGARGYVLKGTAPSEVVDAVRRMAAGEEYVQPSVGAMLGRRPPAGGAAQAPFPPLTDREAAVVRLIALGHTNSEIAELLSVSVRTVETHRAHVLAKLGARTRAELVRRAVELGLAASPT